MYTSWPAKVDEVVGGDQVVALAHVTPASGVVLNPVTNFGLRDREGGTVAVNSSVGMWRKLERMQRNPHVAVAFHTREHALGDRPEYVLVQGRASIGSLSDPDAWLDELGERWERFGGQSRDVGRRWEWWMRAYHWRVNVEIAIARITVWPDLACRGAPEVYGAPPPDEPPAPQRPPKGGTGPRIDHTRAARRAKSLPHALLGWVGADGFPMVVPVDVHGSNDRGIVLEAPSGLVPSGGRRAGLAAHWFARYTFGQHQRKHTGWLEAEPGDSRVVYAPHTRSGYRFPESRFIYRIGSGFVTHRGIRAGRRAGFL
jgi:Pyridoxamine 5'-phosphate oxidase